MELADRIREAVADRYAVEGELGRGGMAVVFLARDLRYDRRVAIKVLRPELSVSLVAERFLREIRILAQLQHPLIVPLYDSGGAEGLLWYVMPFVEGETLRARLTRESQLPVRDTLEIAGDAAQALAYAHQHGVVHRDVKPENILLSGGHALVADFGIARAISGATVEPTSPGIAIGTPAYMSPEQASGNRVVDARSDIYSLGCVVYEMLAGEPPFTGPTPQAVIARHVSEHVPSLAVTRPGLPPGLQGVAETALAKNPVDRFPTAGALADALERLETGGTGPLPRRRGLMPVFAAVGALAIAALASWGLLPDRHPLDPRRVVIYPLVVGGDSAPGRHVGVDVAAALGYALDGAGDLRGVDGWDFLSQEYRDDVARLPLVEARRVARGRRAGFYLTGRLVLQGDSADVLLALRDVRGDSVVARASGKGLAAAPWEPALRALTELLPAMIPEGAPRDFPALSDRNPRAMADFLAGEMEYRVAHFARALEHYERALAEDSLLAIAALRAAQAAGWTRDTLKAERLAAVALNHVSLLPHRYTGFAAGLQAYQAGLADSAARAFRRALASDPDWRDAWMMLGEVFTHLLPDESPLDSLAEAAFAEAQRVDSGFRPALYHAIQLQLRRGAPPQPLLDRFRSTDPDSTELVALELMLGCLGKGPDWNGWRQAIGRGHVVHVREAVRWLGGGGLRQPACAEGAFRALVDSQPQWAWVFGLQSVLVAEGRNQEARDLLARPPVLDAQFWGQFLILDALAGAALDSDAAAAADLLRQAWPIGSEVPWWFLGAWDARRGNLAEARGIADTLAARAERTGSRRTRLLAESLLPRVVLAEGDTVKAIALLQALRPSGRRADLTWYPWEGLGGERLLLAELLLARGDPAGAMRVASAFDAPATVSYLPYVPRSLVLRLQAATALGDHRAAEDARNRLLALGRPDLTRSVTR